MKIKFYKCNVCGKVIAVVKNSPATTICCGQPMVEIRMQKRDESITEKHVPTYTREGNKIVVNVGSILHPQTKAHHIEWVSLLTNKGLQYKTLDTDQKPIVTFNVDEDEEVREISSYCNIHSLYTYCPENVDEDDDDCGCDISF